MNNKLGTFVRYKKNGKWIDKVGWFRSEYEAMEHVRDTYEFTK